MVNVNIMEKMAVETVKKTLIKEKVLPPTNTDFGIYPNKLKVKMLWDTILKPYNHNRRLTIDAIESWEVESKTLESLRKYDELKEKDITDYDLFNEQTWEEICKEFYDDWKKNIPLLPDALFIDQNLRIVYFIEIEDSNKLSEEKIDYYAHTWDMFDYHHDWSMGLIVADRYGKNITELTDILYDWCYIKDWICG